MREIKFRVWDNVDYMSAPFTFQDLQIGNIEFTSDLPIMQYTGLKDKNGNEIYEGDIMAWESYEGTKNQTRWTVEITPYQATKSWNSSRTEDAIVIGNIYETPELLTP